MIKRIIIALLFFYVAGRFAHSKTEGFSVEKIAHHLLEEEGSPIATNPSHEPYRYLSKGGQVYVFLSSDGSHVLKLFRSSRMSFLQFLYKLTPLRIIEKALIKEKGKLEAALHSYQLAEKYHAKQMGLLSCHLSKHDPSFGSIQIIDKLGIKHIIDSSSCPFVIQKKATLVKETLTELMHGEGTDAAAAALHSLFLMIKDQNKGPVVDLDPNLCKNFGFCQTHPIEIDGGRLTENAPFAIDRFLESKEDLAHWIRANHPALAPRFETLFSEVFDEAI